MEKREKKEEQNCIIMAKTWGFIACLENVLRPDVEPPE